MGVAVTLTDTVSLGAVMISILVGGAGLATYFYGVRWRSAAQVFEATAVAWEKAAQRLEERVHALEVEKEEQRQRILTLTARVAELEALPDINAAMHLIRDHDDRTSVAMREHDDNAELRAQRLITAIHELKDGSPPPSK